MNALHAGRVAIGQGFYFLITGVWPLLNMESFEMVTGPKVDKWLVKTVGVLVCSIGAVLLTAGGRRAVHTEMALLGTCSAAGLAAIDLMYVSRSRISRVYLLDALAELLVLGAWAAAWRQHGTVKASRPGTRPRVARTWQPGAHIAR